MKRFSLLRWIAFPAEESRREEIEERLALEAKFPYQVLGCLIFAMQLLMLTIFSLRPGGWFYSPRRMGYVLLYLLLGGISALFLLLSRRRQGRQILTMGSVYVGVVCLWCCAITLLDQLGGNGLTVYSYMLPTTAALAVLRPRFSMAVFGLSCLLLNLLLPLFPGGMHNLFSNMVNSSFITLLSIYLSVHTYRIKVAVEQDRIIIREQMEEIRRINSQLSRMALTDPLTQIGNRRFLEEQVASWLEGPAGVGCAAAGMMLDIDLFKEYNDRFGHQAGDRCLQAIARELTAFGKQREAQVVRYGGEEFFLCLLHCEEGEALLLAELLRRQIEQLAPAPHRDGRTRVTVSIGVSCQGAQEQKDLQKLLEQADQALYLAKAAGRNQVVRWEPPR